MYPNRKNAAQLGQETVEILHKGYYRISDDELVRIKDSLERAVEGTVEYPPHAKLPWPEPEKETTRFQVINDTTLNAARELASQGHRVAALNFASAKNPGGGFLGGSRAQEESLARSSGLYACIQGQPMYRYHRAMRSCMYSNYAIYSPDVPVFRTDEGGLLHEPYLCSFITSPAVNAKIVLQRREAKRREIKDAMRERLKKILSIAAMHGHSGLVLGAWGCGVFGNDVQDIADLFEDAIKGQFLGVFQAITFAILDSSKQQRFIGPFLQNFS